MTKQPYLPMRFHHCNAVKSNNFSVPVQKRTITYIPLHMDTSPIPAYVDAKCCKNYIKAIIDKIKHLARLNTIEY